MADKSELEPANGTQDPIDSSGGSKGEAQKQRPLEDDNEELLKEEDMGDVDINNLVSEEHPTKT